MSPVLPFDIISLVIDIVGENKDTNLLKELALVSHSFLQISSKHLFATVELGGIPGLPAYRVASKKGFVKLLQSRPDVVKYIRKLTYNLGYDRMADISPESFKLQSSNFNDDDNLLSPILPNFLRTISHLNCLTITTTGAVLDWTKLNSSLTSAFLHLMYLPTINHIALSCLHNFPLSSLTPSVNLHRLDIFKLSSFTPRKEDSSPEIDVQLEMMPKIRDLRILWSSRLTAKLLLAKTQDGRPAFNIMDLRRLSISSDLRKDEQNIRYLLQNAKLLENFNLSVGHRQTIVGLHDILSPSPRNLKVLGLILVLVYDRFVPRLLAELCKELEAMAGHNMLEALSFEVSINIISPEPEDFIGSMIQKLEEVLLVKPGWSALREVSLKVIIPHGRDGERLFADKYVIGQLSSSSKSESVAFNYSVCFFGPLTM